MCNLSTKGKNDVILENVLKLVHFWVSPWVCMFSCVMRIEMSKPRKDKRKLCFCVFMRDETWNKQWVKRWLKRVGMLKSEREDSKISNA